MEISRSDMMMGYVENYYRESLFYTAQNNAKGEELDIIHSIIEDMPNQFNPQTATWGLGLWEEMLGITRETENIVDRRSRVMMKLLTLQKITPISLERLIKNVAGANIDIIRNIAPYTFLARVRDDSLNCDSGLIWRIIEEHKEAHMAYYQGYQIGGGILNVSNSLKITYRMAFYPRFNLPPLDLDDSWVLDGGRTLDGYNNTKTVDLHPTGMRFRLAVPIHSGTAGRIRITARAREKIQTFLTIRISQKVEQKVGSETRMRIRFSSACPISNQAAVRQENYLDDEWVLDGSRALDGDIYPI